MNLTYTIKRIAATIKYTLHMINTLEKIPYEIYIFYFAAQSNTYRKNSFCGNLLLFYTSEK